MSTAQEHIEEAQKYIAKAIALLSDSTPDEKKSHGADKQYVTLYRDKLLPDCTLEELVEALYFFDRTLPSIRKLPGWDDPYFDISNELRKRSSAFWEKYVSGKVWMSYTWKDCKQMLIDFTEAEELEKYVNM